MIRKKKEMNTVRSFILTLLFLTGFIFSVSADPTLLPLPLPDGAPKEIQAQGPTLLYTPSEGIRYNLSEDALVQIRIGIQGDPELVYRTIVDWEERKAGENIELWDSKDSGGNEILQDKMVIRIGARHLQSSNLGSCVYSPDGKKEEEKHIDHRHETHDQTKCKDIKIKLISPNSGQNVSGFTNVTVEVDPTRCGYGKTTGHGMRVYIDDERINEEYFTYTGTLTMSIDTTKFVNGKHKLTVNTCDHNDHVGTVSAILNIEN